MSVIIEGKLAFNAERRVQPLRGTSVVVMLLTVGKGFYVELRLPFGEQHSAAQDAALRANRGDFVRAQGGSLRPRTDHGHAAVLLEDITSVKVSNVEVFG